MRVKVSDYIANYFADNGIKTIFTVVGGGAMHMNDSFGHHEDYSAFTIINGTSFCNGSGSLFSCE